MLQDCHQAREGERSGPPHRRSARPGIPLSLRTARSSNSTFLLEQRSAPAVVLMDCCETTTLKNPFHLHEALAVYAPAVIQHTYPLFASAFFHRKKKRGNVERARGVYGYFEVFETSVLRVCFVMFLVFSCQCRGRRYLVI